MGIFDKDRPEGYDEERDGEPRIHPEPLGPAERLKMSAKDVEEFIEHYDDDDEGPEIHGAQGAP